MTPAARLEAAPPRRSGLAVALSLGLHLALVAGAALLPATPPRRGETIAIDVVETPRPPPPAPPPAPEPPPAPQRVIRNPIPAPRTKRLPPPSALPPPPSAPRDDAPARDAEPRVGVSDGNGGMAAPAGNTMYGPMPERAPEPGAVRRYRADATATPTAVTALPEVIDALVPPQEYPPQARREGRAAVVKLRLVVGADGRVTEARVVDDPGYGFGEAAVRVARRYFRFRPARVGDQAVATEIPFTVRFELP